MFKKIFILFVYCLLGVFIQSSFASFPTLALIKPDFLVMLVIFLSLKYRDIYGLLLCFFFGLIFDFASVLYVGPNAASAVISFLVVNYVGQKLFVESFMGLLILGFIVSLTKQLVYFSLIISWIQPNIGIANLTETLTTSVLTPFVVRAISFFGKKTPQDKRRKD
ncbi:MAG: rod shape-determining protein MreD [Deltaproteobacteria bacterium]|jgi:rod shape-determining protein MreD|nr:rod shape-determining protein MreD [Deltaproteobacteria bacterium]